MLLKMMLIMNFQNGLNINNGQKVMYLGNVSGGPVTGSQGIVKKIYANTGLDISNKNFIYPEGGVSVPLDCDKVKEIEFEEEF